MRSTFQLCLPTSGKIVLVTAPSDGYRLIVQRDRSRVRLTLNGHDWTGRYPWIVESATEIGTSSSWRGIVRNVDDACAVLFIRCGCYTLRATCSSQGRS